MRSRRARERTIQFEPESQATQFGVPPMAVLAFAPGGFESVAKKMGVEARSIYGREWVECWRQVRQGLRHRQYTWWRDRQRACRKWGIIVAANLVLSL